MKSRTILLSLIFIILVSGSVYYWRFYRQPAPYSGLPSSPAVTAQFAPSLAPGEAVVIFDFGPQKPKRGFAGAVVKGMTLLDVLKVSQRAGLDITVGGDPGEEKIGEIDGVVAGKDGRQWICYYNGVKVGQSFSAQAISPGDELRFVYE